MRKVTNFIQNSHLTSYKIHFTQQTNGQHTNPIPWIDSQITVFIQRTLSKVTDFIQWPHGQATHFIQCPRGQVTGFIQCTTWSSYTFSYRGPMVKLQISKNVNPLVKLLMSYNVPFGQVMNFIQFTPWSSYIFHTLYPLVNLQVSYCAFNI